LTGEENPPEDTDMGEAKLVRARVFGLIAGLLGAAGVGSAALAAHAGAGPAASLALIALSHAPVFLLFAMVPMLGRLWTVAQAALAVGALGFVIDMGLRIATGSGLGILAPVFGVVLVLAWILVGIACVIRTTR
jgi:hypothetical protein